MLSSRDISKTLTSLEWVNSSRDQKPAFLASNTNSVKLFRI